MSIALAYSIRSKIGRRWHWPVVSAVLAALVLAFWLGGAGHWIRARLATLPLSKTPTTSDHADDEAMHGGHEHGGSADLLELTPQARANLGIHLASVKLQPYERVITVPGIIVERPGQSRLEITAPLTGIVSKIQVMQGEAVKPGQVLFQLRLTHEELVQAQAEFLRTAEELDVIGREVARLEKLADIAPKTLLERRYEQQKAQAVLRAQRQSLVLHGFSDQQVDNILENRTLLQYLDVQAPAAEMAGNADAQPTFQVQKVNVERGQHVNAGDALADLADHEVLFIDGTAFERDISAVHELAKNGWKIAAVVDSEAENPLVVEGLALEYIDAKVDPESRAIHFYVLLPNSLLDTESPGSNQRSITWRFKPGQRVQLRVPVENLPDRIVLPAAAVAKDGPETYVFQVNGEHFARRPVHVEDQDPMSVVIANDGSLYPGDQVAISGAQQMLLALKNKSGGAIDPHAGHTH